MLSGKHVAIGSGLYFLDFQRGGLVHSYPQKAGTRFDIPGSPGDQQIEEGIRVQKRTSWASGEGNAGESKNFWDYNDPNVYDTATANVRIEGQLSGIPTRSDSTITPPAFNTPPLFALGDGVVWAVGNAKLMYSNSGTSWNSRANGITAGQYITAATGGGGHMYYWVTDTTHGIGNGQVRRVRSSGGDTDFTAAGGGFQDAIGMAYLGPFVYRWTGAKLSQYDTTAALPVTGTIVLDTGLETFPDTFYGGMCAGDIGVYMLYASSGETTIYAYENGVGNQIWKLPPGWTGRAICFANGVLYVAGTYEDGAAGLFSYDFQQAPRFIRYIRRQSTLVPTSIAAGHGNQVLIGMSSGEVFIYDSEFDAVSYLDTRTSAGTLNSVITFKSRRMGIYEKAGDKWNVGAWVSDSNTDTTTTDWDLTEEAWDWLLPEEEKAILGFHVAFKPIAASETITVSYQLNEDGTFVDVATITSATSGASTGYCYLPLSTSSSTIKARHTRFKYTGTDGAVVYSVAPRVRVISPQETVEMFLKITPEHVRQRDRGIGTTIAELQAAVTAKSLLPLTIGVESDKKAEPSAITVAIEECEVHIEKAPRSDQTPNEDEILGWVRILVRGTTPL